MATMVSNPLTLILTAKSPAAYKQLKETVETLHGRADNPIRAAMEKLGMVHFARFVFLGDNKLAIITTYDGDFDRYVEAFADAIGPIFDKLFKFVDGAPLGEVSKNVEQFRKFIKDHDVKCVEPFYSAYPKLKVGDILTLQKNAKA